MEEAKKCKNNNNGSNQTKRSKKMLLATTSSSDDSEIAKEEVKLAALSIHVKAKLRAADMPLTMQERALCFTRSFLDHHPPFNNNYNRIKPFQLASALKKEFDTRYGPVWHCIVGKSFGSYVTHSNGGFLYFSFETLFVLLFQTRVQLLTSHD
ncbi:Dynein light chain LC6 flagellar outer arm [Bienertia sinuspersici]